MNLKRSIPWLWVGCMALATLPAAADTVVIDDRSTQFALTGTWTAGASAGYHVTGYQYVLTTASETASATWTPTFPSPGTYEVAVWYVQGPNRPTDARFTVNHTGGPTIVNVDQTTQGSQWRPIGTFSFPATGGSVVLGNRSAVVGKAVIADAVRFVRVGTAYGDLYQAMWVFSWGLGFLNAQQTTDMIAVARANNLNAIFVEVRKTGDSYYVSATEPRGSKYRSRLSRPAGRHHRQGTRHLRRQAIHRSPRLGRPLSRLARYYGNAAGGPCPLRASRMVGADRRGSHD